MKKNTLAFFIGAVCIVGVGAFFAGSKYQESKEPTFTRQFGMLGNGQRENRMMGSRPVSGEIIRQDENSITVKLQDGGSRIVLLSDKTEINKTSQVERTELKVGEKVAAFGTENPDGSITAENIQLNPVFRGIGNDSTPQ
ncbi:hypothetical protein HYW55_04075 [Candidatus Gottesmanbacteria bacterium]|nr:hypothetical protein [Candidatus Gottesmanbacteria bacterium]